MFQEGPRYQRSAEATATILNLYFDPDRPKAELYGKILFCILGAMYAAEEDLGLRNIRPSEN
jgi:hypothetical protein